MPYNVAPRQQMGEYGEALAATFLKQQGLSLIEVNFTCKMGEIDLVMRHLDTLVFVEVRSRSNTDMAILLESIDFRKQQRIICAAQFFLQKKRYLDSYPCRFDVIGITYANGKPQIQWIKQAFSL